MGTRSDRLEEAAGREPELASYYEFYRRVLELQHDARAEITSVLSAEGSEHEHLEARAAQGRPQLDFADLPLDAKRFGELAGAIAQALATYRPELGGHSAADETDWLRKAEQRFEAGGREAEQLDVSDLVADLALMPYLEWAAERLEERLSALAWRQGVCPACGGEPNFAYLEREVGERWLVCSRCQATWRYRRLACPFCETDDHSKLKYYPAGAKEEYRVYVCDACHRYLKVVDLRKMEGDIDLFAEKLVTWELDKAALEKGYH